MFQWLNGPGAVFKDPLPGSTNYLSAYSPNGQLIRSMDSDRGSTDTAKLEEADTEQGAHQGSDRSSSSRRMNVASGQPIPLEEAEDMFPFPGNKGFRSEAVLSEELKDEIWKRVVVDKTSVRRVSADLLVDMRRVGAVVRLKAVEKEWEKKVRSFVCGGYAFDFETGAQDEKKETKID